MGEQATAEGLNRLAGRMDEKTSGRRWATEFDLDIDRISKFAGTRRDSRNLIEFIRTEIGLDRALATLDASHMARTAPRTPTAFEVCSRWGAYTPDPKTFDELALAVGDSNAG